MEEPVNQDSLTQQIAELEAKLKALRSESAASYRADTSLLEDLVQQAERLANAERALKISDARYRALFDVAGDALFIENERDEIIDINQRACELLGYTREELLSMKICDIQAPECRGEPGKTITSELANYQGQPFETLDLHKDGTRIPVEVTNTRLQEAGLFLSIVRDIRERKAHEQARRETFDIIEKSPVVAFLWRNQTDWPVEFVTANVAHIFGYSDEDFLSGRVPYSKVVHPDDLNRVASEVAASIQDPNRNVFTHEPYRIVARNGDVHWITDSTVIRRDTTGAITHFQGIVTDITDRIRAEEALRHSEDEKRMILNSLKELVIYHDTRMRIVWANKAACESVGTTLDALVGRPCHTIWGNSTEPCPSCVVRPAMESGRIHQSEVQTPDGRVWFNQGHPVFDENGVVSGGIETCLEITERKKAEAALIDSKNALRESEKRYQILSELTSDYAYAFRIDSKNKLINEWVTDAFYKITGYAKGELEALGGWEELIHKDDRPIVFDQLKSLLAGESRSVEYRIVTRSGDIRWMLDYARSVWDNQENRVSHIYGAVKDITERKIATNALRESHNALVTILDAIDATIYVADFESYEILFMNRCMQEAFGRDMTGEVCWEAFRNESGPCACCTNPKLIDAQGNPSNEVVIWQDQNPITQRWYMNHDRAIRWIDNRIARIQIATDITELKKLENERLQIEKKLRQSQKMEAIGTLAGGIAHDFNNILTAIIGYLELSKIEIDPDSNIAEYLNEVLQAGIRAKDLVKQILTFARQSEEDMEPVQVSTVGKGVLKFLRSTLPTTITIHGEMTSDSLVSADTTQIHQIFMNLATNAAQAMEPRGGVLTIAVNNVNWEKEDLEPPADLTADRYLKISVSDTGQGIPQEILPFIFEPYYTSKPTGEGTGLGLSVVHGIVKKYGGEIMVSSTLGQGTEFTVFLPVISQQMDQEQKLKEIIPQGRGRILFVDDDPAICDMFGQILTRLGYTPTCHSSSLQALKRFQAQPHGFDLIITDTTMPELTGDELAHQLMKIRPDIPVILCTGYSSRISEKKALKMGIKAFVMKPVVLKDLAQTIQRVLGNKNSKADGHE